MHRRDFLSAAVGAGLGVSLAGPLPAQPWKTKLYKALIGKPAEETFRTWKEAGFDGMECNQWKVSPAQAEQARRLAEKFQMKIHSVLRGWTNFNHPDPQRVQADLASVVTALKAAEGYGADAVLLVPCRIGPPGMSIPEPWEFDIDFDERTGHLKRVVRGDNSKYAEYIKAHNHAIDTSRAAVEKLIPTAEQTKVIIALENVWNNLWVLPEVFAHFVRSFQSPWVRAYFDIGNHVKYAPPERWIRTLGSLIVKCHVKDFLLNPDGRGGKFVHPRDGSVRWPEVRKALDEVGYTGWLTIEDSGLSLKEFSRRLDLIIAGK